MIPVQNEGYTAVTGEIKGNIAASCLVAIAISMTIRIAARAASRPLEVCLLLSSQSNVLTTCTTCDESATGGMLEGVQRLTYSWRECWCADTCMPLCDLACRQAEASGYEQPQKFSRQSVNEQSHVEYLKVEQLPFLPAKVAPLPPEEGPPKDQPIEFDEFVFWHQPMWMIYFSPLLTLSLWPHRESDFSEADSRTGSRMSCSGGI